METFVKYKRNQIVNELLKEPYCFVLLAQIATRARRTEKFNSNNLKIGEALIGDYKSVGLTEQKYRTAKNKLEKWKFITTKITNKGTIATIVNTDVFDINEEQTTNNLTVKQRTGNEQVTTNKNDKNDKNDNKQQQPSPLDKPKDESVDKKKPAKTPKTLPTEKKPKNPKGLTPIQQIVNYYKTEIKEIDINDKKWDFIHFARCTTTAKKLLKLFNGDIDKVKECIETSFLWFKEKKWYDCTFETVFKKGADEFRMGRINRDDYI